VNERDLAIRRPVWSSFLALLPLDCEPIDPGELERLAAPLARSPYSRRELWRVFWDEVLPTWNRAWPDGFCTWAQLHPLCQRVAETFPLLRWIERIVLGAAMVLGLGLALLGFLNPLLVFAWRWAEIVRDASRLIAKTEELRSDRAELLSPQTKGEVDQEPSVGWG